MPIAKINGTSLHYHVKGTGTPIVFIHPPLLTSNNFLYQVAQLSENFKVITFDIRGHGHSEPSAAPLTYPLIVEDMKQLLDFLKVERCYLCGYSTGASIALEAMLTYPDRWFGGILISGMSEVSDWWLKSRIFSAVAACKVNAKSTLAFAIAQGNADSSTTFKNLFEDAKAGNIENWKQYYSFSLRYNCTKRLKAIHLPILSLYGQKDKAFHKYAAIFKQSFPGHPQYFIKDKKHQLPTKAAILMNTLIERWVAGLTEHPKEETLSVLPLQPVISEQEMNEIIYH